MRWMMYKRWCEGGGDRAWWVFESVFLRSPDKGFWACLGDLPPDMPRRPETLFSLCNLILRRSAILRSDSPQSNNMKGNYIHSRERPNANTHYCRLFKATTAYTSACTDAGAALALLLSGGTRPLAILSKIMARSEQVAAALGWLLWTSALVQWRTQHLADGTDP